MWIRTLVLISKSMFELYVAYAQVHVVSRIHFGGLDSGEVGASP